MRKSIKILLASLVGVSSASGSVAAGEQDPLHIIVSLKDQHLKVFRGTEQIAQSNISSGKSGHTTPTGVFSVLQKNRHHRSNIYDDAKMPFMQRLTWSGIALHASNSVPHYPASHGCVRMPNSFASKLFKMRTNGAHVIIEDETSTPEIISHSALFQPQKSWTKSRKYDAWVNAHIDKQNEGFVLQNPDYPARIFITRRTEKDDIFETQRLLNILGFDAGEVDGLMGSKTRDAIGAFQEAAEFEQDRKISNALLDELYAQALEFRPSNGRILVRQHHKPVYSAEISIREPHMPLGSHLITTSNYDRKRLKTQWVGVSLNDRIQAKVNIRSKAQLDKTSARRSTADALSRVSMGDDVREQIQRLMTPGSSVTISDNGISIETGAKATDFIVLTKPRRNEGLIAKEAGNSDRT